MEKYKLLIVDDERIIREGLLSFKWQELGFSASYAASDGEEAIKFLEKEKVDVVLTDIKMPVVDGLKLCEYIREKYPECEIVILTGYKDFDYAKKAISSGVFEYLLKPVDIDEINRVFTSLKAILDKRKIQETEISKKYSLAVKNAIIYMEEHYYEKITLYILAQNVFLSPGYLSSLFTKETGQTVMEYLSNIRIRHAKVLLKKLDLKIYQIAEKVGYSNTKYFTDIFKRVTGFTPIQYRTSS